MNTKFKFLLIFICSFNLKAYAPTNFHRPYDTNFRMNAWRGRGINEAKFRIGGNFEYGNTTKARNWNSGKVDLLAMYQSSQSSISMLLGAEPGSSIDNLSKEISPATDDGVRGHFKLSGSKYEELAYTLYAQRYFNFESIPGRVLFTSYFPFRDMKISNVTWEDQTLGVNNDDLLVQSKITNDIFGIASSLGGLDLYNWHESGISDVVLMFAWENNFKQESKRNLENVKLTGKLGVTLPTGKKKDENKALSLPLGNDGAVGLPCSAQLDLYFKNNITLGIELEFLKLFDETRLRRLKSDTHQTEFLLLSKGRARKEFSPTWKFNLYLQAEHFYRGLSAMVAFQNSKHGNDKLFSKSNSFDNGIINSSQSLYDWSYHNLIFQVNYDFFKNLKKSTFKPQMSFFYKIGLAGRRTIQANTVGWQVAFNF
ncbi:hypothetical protein KAW80_01750 [Candidatus Babeliales bacterium]|nr:hypothetical protein [Candidatus Babeliales bacterium]